MELAKNDTTRRVEDEKNRGEKALASLMEEVKSYSNFYTVIFLL